MGHRTYLGAGVATIDNGRVVDAATVIPITDPRHLLHWRHDPQRYSLENQGFKALVDWIVDHGPVPQPVMFRRRGLLTSEEPDLAYIRKVYPDAAQQHPEQPRLELVYGNRRWHALIEARRIWAERGDESKTRSKARMLAVYAQLDDKDMEDAFVRENSQRAKTSIYEDQLTVREALRRNETWQEIAKLLTQPEKELRRLHEPLTEAHLAVVAAFSAGTLNRSRALRIIKAAPSMGAQVAAMEEDDVVPDAPPKRKRVYLDEIPLEQIRALTNEASEQTAGPVKNWLEKVS